MFQSLSRNYRLTNMSKTPLSLMIGNLSYLHHYAPGRLAPKMAMNRSQARASPQVWHMICRVKLVQRPQVSLWIPSSAA